MMSLKGILVPHDFSETSEAAANYGIALARSFGAQLHFLHVGDEARSAMDSEFPIGLEGSMADAVRERLLKILSPKDQLALRPILAIRPGAPAAEIAHYAKDQDIDLIVMGTHGRGFVGHVVMGSVAEKVVRIAPCPVLTVRGPKRGFLQPDQVPAVVSLGA